MCSPFTVILLITINCNNSFRVKTICFLIPDNPQLSVSQCGKVAFPPWLTVAFVRTSSSQIFICWIWMINHFLEPQCCLDNGIPLMFRTKWWNDLTREVWSRSANYNNMRETALKWTSCLTSVSVCHPQKAPALVRRGCVLRLQITITVSDEYDDYFKYSITHLIYLTSKIMRNVHDVQEPFNNKASHKTYKSMKGYLTEKSSYPHSSQDKWLINHQNIHWFIFSWLPLIK